MPTSEIVITQPGAGALPRGPRRLGDPAGLQRRLRADGVSATIRFDSNPALRGQLPRPCLSYPVSGRELDRLFLRIFPQSSSAGGQTAFTIDPSAIPARAGLWINVRPPARHGPEGAAFSADLRLVYASGRRPSGKAANSPIGFIFGGISGGQ